MFFKKIFLTIHSFIKKKRFELIVLFLIFLIALTYRFTNFPKNIYFGYDQARDAYESQRIYKEKDIVLLGPRTEVDGIFHSPLYYYLVGPLYLLNNGKPYLLVAFLLFVNAIGIFLIFSIGEILFAKEVGFISALIYAFSFEQYQYSYYLSHPSLANVSILIFYLGISLVAIKKRAWGWIVAVLGLALAIHFELLLLYLPVVFLLSIGLFYLDKKPKEKLYLPVAVFILVILLSNFTITELQYDFRAIKALASFMFQSTHSSGYFDMLIVFLEKLALHVYLNLFGFSKVYSYLILAIITLLFLKKKLSTGITILLIWILSPLILHFSSSQPAHFFFTNMGVASGIILLTSYVIIYIIRSTSIRVLLIIFIILGNINLWLNNGEGGLVNGWLAVQEGMLISDEQKVIEYTYLSSQNRPFEIKTLTMPLEIQTTWSYLYKIFGLPKFGFMPYRSQDDVLGYPGHFENKGDEVCSRYLIQEPLRGIALWFVEDFYQEEITAGSLIEEREFGSIKVQKLLKHNCQKS